ncbi:MAG TPA: LCP family protein [Candidatus Binatia bacterium]|nr:LCP family protein [Candidatus Binatia bacterium]
MAALLSAVWPGLGQLSLGVRRAGWLLAGPPLAILLLVIVAIATQDRIALLAIFLDPGVIAGLLIAQVALLVWRLVAVLDAWRRGLGPMRDRGAAVLAIALAFVIVPSIYAAYLTEVTRQAAAAVFAPQQEPYDPHVEVPVASDPDFAAIPTSTPGPTDSPAPELGRFTVLLIGMDSDRGLDYALTDTMIVASLDPVAGAVSMISVPRDLVDLPLPDGRIFRPKINGLVSYYNRNPGKFPGATSGESVLAAGLSKLLNVRIDGWAKVNLPGFVKVIDAIGGVDVTVRKAICDYRYDEYGFTNGFAITPGNYHLNGEQALAYARIRKAAGENDFTRAARQGEIVVAARDRVVKGGFLNDPAGFIEAMGQLISTSLDPATIGQYLPFAVSIQRDRIYRAVITYPLVHGARNDPRGSILVPRVDLIGELAAEAFPPAGTLPTGLETVPEDEEGPIRTNLPRVTCSAPPPTPKPTPTPGPSAGPSPSAGASEPPGPTPEPTPGPTEPPPTDKPGGPKTPPPTESPPPSTEP